MRATSCLGLSMLLMVVGFAGTAAQGDDDAGDARVIELAADAALRFTQDGREVYDIPVVPGEAVLFRVDNTAGFSQNFYIGTDEQLAVPNAATDVGIPDWTTGVRELHWTVPEDVDGLRFGCTVPGHIYTMHGCFSEGRFGPDGTVEPVAETGECSLPIDVAAFDPGNLDAGLLDPGASTGGSIVLGQGGILYGPTSAASGAPDGEAAMVLPSGWLESLGEDAAPVWWPPECLDDFLDWSWVFGPDGSVCFLSDRARSGACTPKLEYRPYETEATWIRGAPAARTEWTEEIDGSKVARTVYDLYPPRKHLALHCFGLERPRDSWLGVAEGVTYWPAAAGG